ncbi:hypothetical protein FJ444_18050 [Aestuariibacter sp. GS-14]|uniref:hypothetical protein n=1 Tax=Alteromonadaceae TaxID=72275 RepID=UPI001125D522|nr:hypothetical protein [Aestuariibacter sp. GS-14]TPV54761.1 hypothetical protein FJ444_18050 [Aestuariibacter sp. GS-14]
MARMSKRGFNNVVIFAMLGMIFLFNLNSFLPSAPVPTAVPLLPADSYVLKIEQGNYKLERVGQQWRWSGVRQSLASTPEQHIDVWRSATMEITQPPRTVLQTEPLITVVWLAGASQGLVYAIVPTSQKVWIQFNGDWYVLNQVSVNALLPWLGDSEEM